VCVPFTENKLKLVARIRMKEWYDNCNSFRILVVGRSEVGKSTFINAMFGG